MDTGMENRAANPHQARVIVEKQDLDTKIRALANFTSHTGSPFATLVSEEQERLIRQLAVMTQYSEILRQRIAAF